MFAMCMCVFVVYNYSCIHINKSYIYIGYIFIHLFDSSIWTFSDILLSVFSYIFPSIPLAIFYHNLSIFALIYNPENKEKKTKLMDSISVSEEKRISPTQKICLFFFCRPHGINTHRYMYFNYKTLDYNTLSLSLSVIMLYHNVLCFHLMQTDASKCK